MMKKKALFVLWLMLSFFTGMNAQSIQELRDSMAAGNLNCQVQLAIEYIYGDSVPQNYDEALRLIRDAAEKGNSSGELLLGICYSEGTGVEKNEKEAFRWFLSSAEKGNIRAMQHVAQAYEYGDGVAPDLQQAIKYYQQAADAGYPIAQLNMAVFYEHGRGLERDMQKSFELMRQASLKEEGAKFLLAKYYFNGWGTEKNTTEALNILKNLKDERYKKETERFVNTIERGDTMSIYEFQFRWIPDLLWSYEKKEIEDNMLTDIMEWQLELGSMFICHYEWDWSKVSAKVYHQEDSVDVIVYRMPEPTKPPHCLYTASVIDRKNNKSRYYTLEKAVLLGSKRKTTDVWMFCGVDKDMSHLNYGVFRKEATEANFLAQVLEYFSSDFQAHITTKKPKKD